MRVLGGTPDSLNSRAVTAGTPQEKLGYYQKGIQVEPHCMKMYAGAAEALIELGDRRRAAEQLVKSLRCYHFTSYDLTMTEYYELGRSLMKEFPDLFSEDDRWDLTTPDSKQRARRASELFKAGQIERSEKLIHDVAFSLREYSMYLDVLRKHYEQLGWAWALALCDLR